MYKIYFKYFTEKLSNGLLLKNTIIFVNEHITLMQVSDLQQAD